ncbi:MAG: BRCT domain-containing protein, partial [Bacteroidota bacterium]|nr:BRCT domain-containing protein [Bacteroidota bacterium]
LSKASYEDIISVDEIGNKIAESITDYFSNKENINLINSFKENGLNLQENENKSLNSDKLKGLTFVVSGKFLNFSREKIQDEIKINEGRVSKSLSSKTNYLIAGKNMGPKKKIKADKLKISIITEDEFMKMI